MNTIALTDADAVKVLAALAGTDDGTNTDLIEQLANSLPDHVVTEAIGER